MLLVLALLPAPAALAELPAPPSDWLAYVTVSQPIKLLDKVDPLLDRLGLPENLRTPLALVRDPQLGLAGGAVTIGVAAPEGDLEQVYPFAILPTPPEQTVALLRGEMTGESGVASLGGLEVTVLRLNGATCVTPVEHQASLKKNANNKLESLPVRGDITLAVSRLGLKAVMQRSNELRSRQDFEERIALIEFGWPPSLKWINAAVASNTPLAACFSELFREAQVGLSLDDSGRVVLAASGHLAQAVPARTSIESVRLPKLAREPLISLSGGVGDKSLRTAAALLLAYSEGRPDELELPSYPDGPYFQVKKEAIKAVELVEAVDAAVLSRRPDDPFHSNRIALLRVTDEQAFLAASRESAEAWNRLIEISRTRQRLTMAPEQVSLSPQLPKALRLTTNVAAGMFPPATGEVLDILQRYYGPDGKHVILLQPLGEGRVLAGDLPAEQFVEVLNTLRAAPQAGSKATQQITGEWDLGAYAAWQNAMLADYMADAIGFIPPADLGTAPIKYAMSQHNGECFLKVDAAVETTEKLLRSFLDLTNE